MGLKPKISFGGGSRGWIGDSPFIFLDTARIRGLGWNASLTIRQSVEKDDRVSNAPRILKLDVIVRHSRSIDAP